MHGVSKLDQYKRPRHDRSTTANSRYDAGPEYAIVAVTCSLLAATGLSGGDLVVVCESAENLFSADPVPASSIRDGEIVPARQGCWDGRAGHGRPTRQGQAVDPGEPSRPGVSCRGRSAEGCSALTTPSMVVRAENPIRGCEQRSCVWAARP